MPTKIKEISLLPNRIRIKCNGLKNNKSLASSIEMYLKTLKGIRAVYTNINTTSIIIKYDQNIISYPYIKGVLSKILEYPERYSKQCLNVDKNYSFLFKKKNNAGIQLFFYSLMFLIFRIKQPRYGKYSISKNSWALFLIALVVITTGYPLIKKKVVKTNNEEFFLKITAIFLTIARESNEGVALLALNSFSDYLKYNSDLNTYKLLKKDNDFECPSFNSFNGKKLKIFKEVDDYSTFITWLSLGAASLDLVIKRNLLNAITIPLVLSPMGTQVALSSGIQQYTTLLQRRGIYLKDINLYEKLSDIKHIIILKEKLGVEEIKAINKLRGLKREKIIVITGDSNKKVNNIREFIGIDSIYGECDSKDRLRIMENYNKKGNFILVVDDNGISKMEEGIKICLNNNPCYDVKKNSDCIIFDDKLEKLVELIQLTTKTRKLINQSIVFSKAYNIGLGFFAIGKCFSPFTAKTINTLNSLLVVILNYRISILNPSKKTYKSTSNS
jgi:cation transport ATPase